MGVPSYRHPFIHWDCPIEKPFVAGWWCTYPSEKYYEFVSWDDDIPN